MIVTPIPVTLRLPAGGAPRSEGTHVSSIIRCVAAESGILKKEWVEDLSLVDVNQQGWWEGLDEPSKIRMSMGMAWENWYIGTQLAPEGVTHQPGEMEVGGVYMTPDGESLDVIITPNRKLYEVAIHEVKLTYKSTKTIGDLSSQWMWVTQTKAYVKGAKARVAYVHVNAVCGDYKFPITPRILKFRLDFTQYEIDESWDLLMDYLNHRRLMEREEDEGLE